MIKVKDWIAKLKYIEAKRTTYYDNTFPGNCGQIHQNGILSFDCIGLVKSVINEPSIATKTSPYGYYVKPGQVIPDYDEINILYLCTGVEWRKFKNIVPGEYLYMAGHGAVYVGDFKDGSGTVNTIECTTDMGENGVTTTYLDTSNGTRWDHKGGNMLRGWEAHGKLTKYIDYSPEKKEEPSMWTDLPKTDKHYKQFEKLGKLGIYKGTGGKIYPSKTVTRRQLAIILCRLLRVLGK